MNGKDFQKIVDASKARIDNSISTKNKEYASSEDKLSNFKDVGLIKGETPEKSLWGMWVKHIASLKAIVLDLDEGILPSEKLLDEKAKDNINYTILLEALIHERRQGGTDGDRS
ncbi:MAG: hypothetical protein KAR06_11225 [Deltaproteobacteria bacterium]|nr:hypothetical protein [Deltaproteobacteria bacterium]